MKSKPSWLWGYLLSLPALSLLGLVALGPIVFLVRMSLFEAAKGQGFFIPDTWSLDSYTLFQNSFGIKLILFTLVFGMEVAFFSVFFGFPIAFFLKGLSPTLRVIGLGAVLLPKVASMLVILFGLQQLLGNSGPINQGLLFLGVIHEPLQLYRNHLGALIAEVYLVLPLAILMMAIALFAIDPSLESASSGLGASAWQTFWRVTFPLALPGVILAGEISLIWGLGAILGPLFLGSPEETTLSLEFFHQSFELLNWPRGAAMGVALMILVLVGLIGFRRSLGRWGKMS